MPWHPTTINSEILSVHAALVPVGLKGKVVMLGGDEHWSAQAGTDTTLADPALVDRTALYDVETKLVTRISSPTTDVFCSGHAFLGDGRLLIGGGTEAWTSGGGPGGGHGHFHGQFGGHRAAWIFNHLQNAWQRVTDMTFVASPGDGGGRWYPTLITLPSGDVAAFGGHPSRHSQNWHENNIPERFSPVSGSWTRYPTAFGFEHGSLPGNWYPRATLMPDGRIFFTTVQNGKCRFFDPATGALGGPEIDPAPAPYNSGWDYAVLMMPLVPGDNYRARIIALGGVSPQKIEFDPALPLPTWGPAGNRQGSAAGKARTFACPVYLPTGQILVPGGINGSSDSQAVKEPEIYTPDIDWATRTYGGGQGTWQTVEEPAQIARNYHSVALLLPDGSVFTAGSSINGNSGDPATFAQRNLEIFFPTYFSDPSRPLLVTAPKSLSYHQTEFTIELGSVAQAIAIRRVALIRCGSVTHSGDFDQRYVALEFQHMAASPNLRVEYPNSPGILPPGYYMLWVVNDAGLPCQTAKFVRVAQQGCQGYAERSVFSVHEVDALLPAGPPARFSFALSVFFDGFLESELTGAPTPSLHFDHASGPAPASMTLFLRDTLVENAGAGAEIPKRITYVYDVLFSTNADFAGITETRNVFAKFLHHGHTCTLQLLLTQQPNPYMLDGTTSWLSTDLRVFQLRASEDLQDIPSPGTDPIDFIQRLITEFNKQPPAAPHPFDAIVQDQYASRLELSREVGGERVYNFAIAKVRYLGASLPAENVKVFFRGFKTASSSFAYAPTGEYRRTGTVADAMPLLGRNGSEIVSVPYYAVPRIDTGSQSMLNQAIDTPNRRTLTPAAPQEFVGYYGCWLDFNQTDARIPLTTTTDGPWPAPVDPNNPTAVERRSLQQYVRGLHQCLVAEVYFEPNPSSPRPPDQPQLLIPLNATPGTSDKLSQRNLAILESDNPGGPDAHLVEHTFELRPSRFHRVYGGALQAVGGLTHFSRGAPDDLVIRWAGLPAGTLLRVYLPEVEADEILALAQDMRLSPASLVKEDDHTLLCRPGQITYLPVPGARAQSIIGLLSLQLPETVVTGQSFSVTAAQVDGVTRKVIGTFQLSIPVSNAPAMLPRAKRELSVLRYISLSIRPEDRWRPIFDRYLGNLERRYLELGGDPDVVEPSPDGTGIAPLPERPVCSPRAFWLLSLVVALTFASVGAAVPAYGAPLGAVGLVAILASLCGILKVCRTDCRLTVHFLLGLAAAGVLLSASLLAEWRTPLLHPVLLTVFLLNFLILAWVAIRNYAGQFFCCDPCGPDGVMQAPKARRRLDAQRWQVAVPTQPVRPAIPAGPAVHGQEDGHAHER